MPRAQARKERDSREHQPQPRDVVIPVEGPATLEVEPLEVIQGPGFENREEELKFMEDRLTILIHPSTDKNAEMLIPVGVNGRMCYVPRNKKVLIARKYVERLARAKEEGVTQNVKAETPMEVNRLTINSAQKYPFIILHDPDPVKGPLWFQKVSAEA